MPRKVGHLSFQFVTLVLLSLTSMYSSILYAQTGSAAVTGIVTDPSKAIIVGAKVAAINVGTNVRYEGTTNQSGDYYIPSLPPGTYRIEVEKMGFKTDIQPSVVLHTQDAIEINFEMALGSASESITVNANTTNDNPAVSMTVDREFVENMPLNARSFQDLIQLTPGAVSDQNGYYSINGQRTDSNNYTVDGVSANLGGFINDAGFGNIGAGLSGSVPSQTVLGTTQSLTSIDSLQEFSIQTSGYTAEYGRTPGGQVQFTTRSGTNDLHGSLFEYLRNTDFDAKSYAEDYFDEPKAPEHQNDFGGTVGGPVIIPKIYDGKDKTFFFISYEGLRLLSPTFESENVPTQAFRNWASPNVQPFLNASPLPNGQVNQDGCTIPSPTNGQPTACDARFNYSYSQPSRIDSISVRVDQNLGQRFRIFLRYADTPSSYTLGADETATNSIDAHNWTAGLTARLSSALSSEARFNYSHDGESQLYDMKAVGGSVPVERSLLIPPAYDNTYAFGEYFVYAPGTSLIAYHQYGGGGSVQHQYQLLDNLTWSRGRHDIKFGIDWRRLTPSVTANPYQSVLDILSMGDIQSGYATTLSVSASAPGEPVFHNLSVYAQDHWKITPTLTVDYGLRWELNPPPGPANGRYPVTLTSSDLATATLAPIGTAPYEASYDHFAPRFGFAWNAIPSPRHAVTVRGGFGIFYDTGQSVVGNLYVDAPPFGASAPTLTHVPLPASDLALAPPNLDAPLVEPYPFFPQLQSPSLTLPYTEQWNVSVDQELNSRNTLTASYVGNVGRKLLFTQYYSGAPDGNQTFPNGLAYTSNVSTSSYDALQVLDTGRVAKGLDLIAGFTWEHALDNASTDLSDEAPLWGNSNYDIRRSLNVALNYQTNSSSSGKWWSSLWRDWIAANRFTAQSGYPLNIYENEYAFLPNGTQLSYYPDLVPGVPVYLHGSAADVNGQPVPGNWRLNSAAFALVPTDPTTGLPVRQGTLGRNFVRNPGFWALNTAIQRGFAVRDSLRLIFRLEAFNVFNHPNLGNPDTNLGDATFGELLGSVTTIGSSNTSNTLYSMGAARSLQFSLKLQF